jgi:LacI family transcriptional regulator
MSCTKVTECALNVSPVVRWIKSLPKPLGIMAARDLCARQAVESCHLMGLRVPEDVAVVGVDNRRPYSSPESASPVDD